MGTSTCHVTECPCADAYCHDGDREKRVRDALKAIFQNRLHNEVWVRAKTEDEGLYKFLRRGIGYLERYCEIRGIDILRRQKVVRIPPIRVGASLGNGIMDILVTSSNMDPEELLSILDSYHEKKRFSKLRNGDFDNLGRDKVVEDRYRCPLPGYGLTQYRRDT